MGNTLGGNSRQFTREQHEAPTLVGTIAQSKFIEYVTSATKRPITAIELKLIMNAVSRIPYLEGKPTYRYFDDMVVACFPLHTVMGDDGRLMSDSHKEQPM